MAASPPILTAVFRKEVRHLLSHPGKPLAVRFRGDVQNIPSNPAVNPEHCAQDKDAPAFRVQALEHNICTGQLQFLRQDSSLHILGQVGYVFGFSVADVVPVELETQGKFGKHMFFIVLEMVRRDAEYPGGEGTVPFKGG